MVEAVSQFHFTPDSYLELIRGDVPAYDELQDRTAEATRGIAAERILELGTGTGETTRRVLAVHPGAIVVGVDSSAEMLAVAAEELQDALEPRHAGLEDELPPGPFDLVFSALAVHHLDAAAKADLFRRVARVLRPGGRFVLADVVVPADPEDAVTPLTPDFDLPDPVDRQLEWLRDAGFDPHVEWTSKDLAIVVAGRP